MANNQHDDVRQEELPVGSHNAHEKGLSGRDRSTLDNDGAADGRRHPKWAMGILNDKDTEEVPGTILLLSAQRNEPLGLDRLPARRSASSLPSDTRHTSRSSQVSRQRPPSKKYTPDGTVILDPQPEDSANDPLNWPAWRRDIALLSIGFYCMLGGGMTPILAAGYNDVSQDYGVSTQNIALTTGFFMLGCGLGSVIMSPTAILIGKRPVYLFSAIMFCVCCIWAAASPSYASLLVSRIFQGIAVSPVECLPSATVAEIYFLHERAYRIGIYTLLLLGGKNLIPLVSAAITQGLTWRWIFWIMAIVVGFAGCLLFLFVPETFWDRTPHPRPRRPHQHRMTSFVHSIKDHHFHLHHSHNQSSQDHPSTDANSASQQERGRSRTRRPNAHVGFAEGTLDEKDPTETRDLNVSIPNIEVKEVSQVVENEVQSPDQRSPNSPSMPSPTHLAPPKNDDVDLEAGHDSQNETTASRESSIGSSPVPPPTQSQIYTNELRQLPPQSFIQCLRPYSGRTSHDNWFKVAFRPFVLFAYPSILWSAAIYACSVGWLIVLSEVVAEIYSSKETYNFSSMATGLVYISPFVGGVLGTAVAGRVSDVIVRFMTRRNGGIYEPEFRLVMAIPIMVCTAAGLMGFGWSAEERDLWIVPTIFFGILSFGCTLGSTTAITFCVDSYRQYAGEALVTLNFSKNVLHGFVFAFFLVDWLKADGAKTTFLAIGGIHIAILLTSIPVYIYGKRARMWTVRRNLMEKF